MTEHECELKLAVPCEQSFTRLLQELGPARACLDQENSYWDSTALCLHRAQMLLRVRRQRRNRGNWQYYLTVKGPAQVDATGYFQALEQEHLLTVEQVQALHQAGGSPEVFAESLLVELWQRFSLGSSLICWGQLQNKRLEYPLSDEILLEADCSDFGAGEVAWELEMETDDPILARKLLDPYLQRARVEVLAQTLTKSERLRRRLKNERPC